MNDSPQLPDTDWFQVLLKILATVAANEGTFFERDWGREGVTPEQREIIVKAYDEMCLKYQRRRVSPAPKIGTGN